MSYPGIYDAGPDFGFQKELAMPPWGTTKLRTRRGASCGSTSPPSPLPVDGEGVRGWGWGQGQSFSKHRNSES